MFETGVGIRNPLFFIGVVEERVDKRHESRVRVRAFGVHGTIDQIPTEDLPWAICVAGNYQMNVLPQQNHWVLGVFLDGRDAQQPLILGTIPTFMSEILDPERSGWGNFPEENANSRSKGSLPEDFGKPQNHDLARGEYIEENYPLEQENNRALNVKVAQNPSSPSNFTTWSEPSTAYAAKYPDNVVYESPDGKTVVELDSTEGAERFMAWHRGSFIQIDSNGTRVDKSKSDHYEVNDENNMVYIGGRSSVTIMGDSHVYVEGNKIEQIKGDLVQIVHGNHLLSVGGQINLNASEEIQARGAQIRIEANSSNVNIKSARNTYITCDEDFNLKAFNVNMQASFNANLKANFQASFGGGLQTSVRGALVAIDNVIFLANQLSRAPGGALPAAGTDLPEPPEKSTSTVGYRNTRLLGSAGYTSRDDELNSNDENPDQLDTTLGQTRISRQQVYDKLRDAGLTHEQAIGAMANINRESSFRPGAIGDNGNSFGLFQYNKGAGRLDPFVQAVPNWQTNVDGQLEYTFNQENTGTRFKNTSFSSSLEAANWFTNYFEVPQERASYTAPGGYNSRIVPQLEAEITRRP